MEKVLEAIQGAGPTPGRIGDGKIFALPVAEGSADPYGRPRRRRDLRLRKLGRDVELSRVPPELLDPLRRATGSHTSIVAMILIGCRPKSKSSIRAASESSATGRDSRRSDSPCSKVTAQLAIHASERRSNRACTAPISEGSSRGERTPTLESLVKLADALGVEPATLLRFKRRR